MRAHALRWLLGAALAVAGPACTLPETVVPAPPRRPTKVEIWTRQAETLRGLQFESPVEVTWILSSNIPGITRQEIEADLPPGYVDAYRDAYAALGVLPADLDLLDALTSLQEDQLVGLYSTRQRKMFVVRGLSAESDRVTILVHELVHALQHQHFPRTIELLQGLRRNDDVVSSIAAAIEGDASLTMHGAVRQRDLALARTVSSAMLEDLRHPTGVMARMPRFLSTSLIFPYAYGVLLAGQSWHLHGNAGLDQLVRDPPLSTVRVLYPDDTDPVRFVRLPLDAVRGALIDRSCSELFDNVAGALTLRVLFEDRGPAEDLEPMLRGWAGDRFVQLTCEGGSELAWLTLWDDVTASADFARRYGAVAPAIARDARLSGVPEVYRRGATVLVVTPGLRAAREALLERSEIRAYAGMAEWVADACFPESPCPGAVPPPVVPPPVVAGDERIR